MKPALIAIAAVLTLAVSAVPASAQIYVEGTGEPAYTNSAQNTQWIRWQSPPGTDGYRINYRYYANNSEVASPTYDSALTGTSWANWSGVATLVHGGQYGICAQGSYSFPNDSLFFPDGPNSCSMGTMEGKRASTTIDRSKPEITVAAAGGAQYTKTSLVPLHIDFTDDVAGPYPGNFVCAEAGAGDACSGIYGYSPECSVPNAVGKVNSFDCAIELSGSAIPDGPVRLCAIAADAAIPDNPSSANQTASADKANLSTGKCDTITLDRVAPAVAINASSTTVTTGQPVSFAAQASDAGSGLAGQQWAWGDGTPGSGSDTAVHSLLAAGHLQRGAEGQRRGGQRGCGDEGDHGHAAAERWGGGAGNGNGGGSGGSGGSNGSGNGGGSAGGGGSTTGGGSGSAAAALRARPRSASSLPRR